MILYSCAKTKENLWCLKAILRVFELVSGLRVNFHKSCLIGINVPEEELSLGARFLYCKVGVAPFKFLGVPVGANPRVRATWAPLIKKMKDRLSTWRSRQLSMGGRKTLINSVLASLPLYYFSFYKAPKIVIKEMVKIQRNFIWGGNEERKKIAWVKWKRLCLPKDMGGLGIRNMEVFNIALLGKWRWKVLVDKDSLWAELLEHLYGGEGVLTQSKQPLWWKDLGSIDESLPYCKNWSSDFIKLRLGSGNSVKFWTYSWCSPCSFAELFPQLYNIAANKNQSVAEAGNWIGDSWVWNSRFTAEAAETDDDDDAVTAAILQEILQPINPSKGVEDKWCWQLSTTREFTVKTAYAAIISASDGELIGEFERKTLKKILVNFSPFKISCARMETLDG